MRAQKTRSVVFERQECRKTTLLEGTKRRRMHKACERSVMKKCFNKVFSCAMAFIFAFGMTPTLPSAMAEEAKADDAAARSAVAAEEATAEDQSVSADETIGGGAAAAADAGSEEATLQTTTLADGTYSVDVASTMGMLTPMTGDEGSYIVVKGDKAYVVFNGTSAPDNNGAVKYDSLYRGKRTTAPEDAASATCVAGIPIYAPEGSTSYAYGTNTYTWSDGTGVVYGYSYVLDFDKDALITLLDDGADEDIDFTMRYTSHYVNSSGSSESASKWSGTKDQYLTLSNVARKSDSTDVPGSGDSGDDDPVDTFWITFQYSTPNSDRTGAVVDFTDAVITIVDETGKSYDCKYGGEYGGLGRATLPKGHTYTITMSKEGCAEVEQGAWITEKHQYAWNFTGNASTVITFTEANAKANLIGRYMKVPQAADDLKAALEMVPANTKIFTDSTAAVLKTAVDKADITCIEQDELAQMTSDVLSALTQLVPKDGTYSASITRIGKKMFNPATGTLTVKDGVMTYTGLTTSDTFTKYYKPNEMYFDGILSDEDVETKTTAALNEAVAAEESGDTSNVEEGTKREDVAKGYSFDIPVQKLDSTIVVGAYSSTKSLWNSTGCFYVDAASLVKTPDTLAITNNTTMFKAHDAQLIYAKDGSTTLRVTLGSAYHYLCLGTYEQALLIGDDPTQWIAGTENDDGKYVFDIPVADSATTIPLISISNSRYNNYKAGTGTFESALLARQLELDVDDLALTTGDYQATQSCTVNDYGTGIANGTSATIDVLGCPSANNYKYAVSFKLASTYDKVFVGSKDDAAKAADSSLITPASDGTITLDPKDDGSGYEGAKSVMASGVGTTIAVRNAQTQTWAEYVVTPQLLDNTVSLDKVSTIDDVKALIEKLPAFEQVTADHEMQIVTAERAYNTLSAADQAKLDKEVSKNYAYSTLQPYGRVLESAVWALEALAPVDNKTTLAEGVYNANSGLSSEYSKGKSTSPRNRPWSVNAIYVDADGNATAAVTVESDGYTYMRFGGQTYYNQAAEGENCLFYVPIEPNSKFYFGAYSTSMRCEIAFTLDNTLPASATPIDGSALISAIEAANDAHDAVNISDDGSDLKIGDKYVPTTEAAKLEAAIAQATAVLYGNKSTKDDMDAAIATLNAAVEAFNAAQVDVKDLGWERVSGGYRYDTAAAVAQQGWKSSKTAVLATAWQFPDALAASAIAGSYDCPVLLTNVDELPTSTLKELVSLGVENVVIMGGSSAVSNNVEKAVQAIGIKTERVYGDSRDATAVKAFEKACQLNPDFDTVVVAYGWNFPDALSISPYSYATKSPIVLTDGEGLLSDDAISAIKGASNVKKVVIVGGAAVVSDQVMEQLGSDYDCERLAGETRYETSVKIAQFELKATDATGANIFVPSNPAVATGENFPDALTGGAFCGHRQSILLLATDDTAQEPIQILADQKASRVKGFVLGGDKAVSDNLLKMIEEGTK